MALTMASTAASPYRHEAFLWRDLDEYLAGTVRFIREALDGDVPVMVAVVAGRWRLMRDALGRDARWVEHVDMAQLGRNPARMVPTWLDFVSRHGGAGRPMRGIGEAVWHDRRPAEIVECHIQEALLDVAIPRDTPLWLLCPYDATTLSETVLAEARRGHGCIAGSAGWDPAAADARPTVPTPHPPPSGVVGPPAVPTSAERHAALRRTWELTALPLPTPAGEVEAMAFGPRQLGDVRGLVRRHAGGAGLSPDRVDDLALAVSELAANSVDHGGGHGRLRVWREADSLVVEVEDGGRITDVLVGRRTPTLAQERGRGVWMANQLTDLVQVRSLPTGTVSRVVTWV